MNKSKTCIISSNTIKMHFQLPETRVKLADSWIQFIDIISAGKKSHV